jgi:signal peptidase I
MDPTPPPSIAETLANLSTLKILAIITVLTVFRLGLVRVAAPAARSFAEVLESALIAIVLVFMVIRPFVLQAFFIPSPSMEPTLLGNNNVGDHILAGNPDFIKRLIGKPGDLIETSRGRVLVEGQEYNHAAVRNALGHAGLFGQDAMASAEVDQADHHVRFTDKGVLADGKLVPNTQLALALGHPATAPVQVIAGYNTRDGKRLYEPFTAEDPDYDLQFSDGKPLKRLYASEYMRFAYEMSGQPITQTEYERYKSAPAERIPQGKLLVMGDNRNDSNDGTAWGLLDAPRIVGHAVFIFWPLDRLHPIH